MERQRVGARAAHEGVGDRTVQGLPLHVDTEFEVQVYRTDP